MYKILVLMTSLVVTTNAYACDICGCAMGGSYVGILPKFNTSFVGLKYQYSRFRSHHPSSTDNHPMGSEEKFTTFSLWGRFVPHKRVQLFAFIPFHFTQRSENGLSKVYGLGDASFLVNYIIYNDGDKGDRLWKQALQIGAGIKLPSGKTDLIKDGLMLHQKIQPGSGSFDFPFNAIYTIRHRKAGLNVELNYKQCGSNKFNYQFGNAANASLRYFRWYQKKNVSLLPHAGLSMEHGKQDRRNNKKVEFTGGQTLLSNLGVDVYCKHFSAGISHQMTLAQYIGEGTIKALPRWSANIIYLF